MSDDLIMSCEQWKDMILNAIREGTLSEKAFSWVGDCILTAYEDGRGDEAVFEEIEAMERQVKRDIQCDPAKERIE